MTPAELAALHGRCFVVPRPFTEKEFAELLDSERCFLCAEPGGFALARVIADEAELLTLAVDPVARRQGLGRRLLAEFEETAQERGAARVFLEVSADNAAALALYTGTGYSESGRRRGYYRSPDGRRIDAILMDKPLVEA